MPLLASQLNPGAQRKRPAQGIAFPLSLNSCPLPGPLAWDLAHSSVPTPLLASQPQRVRSAVGGTLRSLGTVSAKWALPVSFLSDRFAECCFSPRCTSPHWPEGLTGRDMGALFLGPMKSVCARLLVTQHPPPLPPDWIQSPEPVLLGQSGGSVLTWG